MKSIDSHWFLIVAYILLVGSLALDYHFYYPDELHYTDAAIQMIQSGDYLTPIDGSNHARFNKPIVSYWFVAAGYRMFGIHAFGSRIFFLLAGATICLLVFLIGRLIYNDQTKAYIGMAIAATQIPLIMSSIRSIPDVLLCLFMTLSVLGVAGFIKYGQATPVRYHWMLYLGLALAVGVKGIHALALGIAALAFLCFNPWQAVSIKKLLHWPSMVTAFFLGAWWFVSMYLLYGQDFSYSFLHDQVGTRISGNVFTIGKNLLLSLGFLLLFFIPWIFFIRPLHEAKKWRPSQASVFGAFTIFFVMVAVLLISFVSSFYERYLLPAIPLLSVWMGHLVAENLPLKKKALGFWIVTFMVLHVIILSFAALMLTTMSFRPGNAIFLTTGILLTFGIFYKLIKSLHLGWFALSMLLFAFNLSLITRNISSPDEGEQIFTQLKGMTLDNMTSIGFGGDAQVAAKIRVACSGQYQIMNLSDEYLSSEIPAFDLIIGNEKMITELPSHHYTMISGAASWNPHQGWPLLKAIVNGTYHQELENLGKRYYIFSKKASLK
ncbi:MAG: glycosyltransferase family 39 protein [Prolixibacteraceae bacterium]|nr:glycosyltransferase family 39 protein [Prolixibacteraceae bacterium]